MPFLPRCEIDSGNNELNISVIRVMTTGRVAQAQHQIGPHGGICHSNHMQMTEDQVIERVIKETDVDGDGIIHPAEMIKFIAHLAGEDMTGNITDDILAVIDFDLLHHLAGGYDVTRHDFVQAWHHYLHDSIPFVESLFDRLLDTNHDGHLDGTEIQAIVSHAMQGYGILGAGGMRVILGIR
ncbi:hypothetical protein BaRGS_00037064 [Batillaria attramentaria]|uniref:EF-hand domain-containing protein n=1 Tax=Batillaria attramentaria TaxID=370345 RepID=A0ABD0J9Y5_9CAEN